MMTATVRELRNHYLRVLAKVEAGEAVAISRRGKVVARLIPANAESDHVDWTRSAALKGYRDRKTIRERDLRRVLDDNKGRY